MITNNCLSSHFVFRLHGEVNYDLAKQFASDDMFFELRDEFNFLQLMQDSEAWLIIQMIRDGIEEPIWKKSHNSF